MKWVVCIVGIIISIVIIILVVVVVVVVVVIIIIIIIIQPPSYPAPPFSSQTGAYPPQYASVQQPYQSFPPAQPTSAYPPSAPAYPPAAAPMSLPSAPPMYASQAASPYPQVGWYLREYFWSESVFVPKYPLQHSTSGLRI
jgi:hypothetical protein